MHRRRKCWWVVHATRGIGPAKAQEFAQRLAAQGRDIVELDNFTTGDPGDAAVEFTGLSDELLFRLLQALREDGFPESRDERLLLPGDNAYPNSRFLDANPPLPVALWAIGRTSLLDDGRPSLGIAGSRSAGEDLLALTHQLGSLAVRQGWKVISGLAAGVDSAGHQGALDAGGDTIGVMASGVDQGGRHWQPESLEDVCIVSQFQPRIPWSGPGAMQRNATIAALSDHVVIIAAGESGGSWEMGQLCLKKKKPLFVLDIRGDEGPGNQKLIRAGARAVTRDDLASVFNYEPPATQTTLF